jgi:CelD/BcsL family acetyltransferase involved in cellulose biosynthesis
MTESARREMPPTESICCPAHESSPPTETEPNHFTIHTIRDLGELDDFRQVWSSWHTTRDANFDFFSGTIRLRCADCKPNVLVLSRGGKPNAILVGMKQRRKVPFRLGSVIVHQSETEVLEFVDGGLLGDATPENCRALIREVMRSLEKGDADLALWEQLDVQSPLYFCALEQPRILARAHWRAGNDRWLMNFPEGLEDFYSRLRRSQRSKLRRKYKRVINTFGERVQVRAFRSPTDLDEAVRDMDAIWRNSLKGQLYYNRYDTPQIRKKLLLEAEFGWLLIFILYIDGQPVSFWNGTLYERCLKADYVDFDYQWAAFSPGIVLFLTILENLRNEQIDRIDFGRSHGHLHDYICDVRITEKRLLICAPRLSGLRLNLLEAATSYGTDFIDAFPLLRRAWRVLWERKKAAAIARISRKHIADSCILRPR